MGKASKAGAVVAQLAEEYERSTTALRSALTAFIRDGRLPDPALRARRAFVYPELRLIHEPTRRPPRLARSYARFSSPGVYAVTVTRPDLFADYLTDQLTLLMADFEVDAEVGRSEQEIPFPYVLDPADAALADVTAGEIARHFPT